ncbi:MAG: hypothetical protein JW953_22915 [Anaerolineae bacterium]|nr:hypothetical protein [Anaerolineae bacterium]
MLTVEKVDTFSPKQVKQFVNLPYRLYAHHPHWVPPLRHDAALYLNRRKHFFYDHSAADFFIAARNGRAVGRIAVLDHRLFNNYHQTRQAQFYLFECEDDPEAATALFEQAFVWAKARGLNKIIGPKGLGTLDPFGILIEGFEHRQMMIMSTYNYPYYQNLVEAAGFTNQMRFSSYYLNTQDFRVPNWIHNLAEQTRHKRELEIKSIRTVREGLPLARQMVEIYNRAMVNNWEYYPLPEREIAAIVESLRFFNNPRFLKFLAHGQEMAGALLVIPDLSAPLQRAKGRLNPWSLVDLYKTMRRPQSLLLAWFGILPQFRLQGGNALIITELEKTIRANPTVQHLELHQVADSALQVRRDLEMFGLKPYKVHQVFAKQL